MLEHAGNINTPADEVRKQLLQTVSLPVLVRFKWALHTNIDDILGLGDYSPEAEYLATKQVTHVLNEEPDDDEWTEEDQKRKDAEDKATLAFFNRNKAAKAATNAHRKNNAETISHFQPVERGEAI